MAPSSPFEPVQSGACKHEGVPAQVAAGMDNRAKRRLVARAGNGGSGAGGSGGAAAASSADVGEGGRHAVGPQDGES